MNGNVGGRRLVKGAGNEVERCVELLRELALAVQHDRELRLLQHRSGAREIRGPFQAAQLNGATDTQASGKWRDNEPVPTENELALYLEGR